MTESLDLLVAAHLESCTACAGEPLFAAIDEGGAAPDVAVMGRAVLIAHLHPEGPEPGDEGKPMAALKKAVADDVAATDDRGDPSDTWTITNQAGQELGRVWGDTYDTARHFAERIPAVRGTARREGGYLLRRLGQHELHQYQPAGQPGAS